MTRSERLRPVQRISESREREAARALGECQQALVRQQQQLTELEGYRREYQGHMLQSGRGGISAQRLMQLQQFLANIDRAIVQQQQGVEATKRRCDELRRHWFQARGRAEALDKVSSRYREEEMVTERRREQRESDEFAQRNSAAELKK